MPEAWIVREGERQKLIEKLIGKVFTYSGDKFLDEKQAADFEFYTARVVLQTLNKRGFNWDANVDDHEFFDREIWGPICSFGKTPSERNALLARFLEKLLGSVLNHFHAELRSDEIHNTRAVFGTDSTMDEVPFPGDRNTVIPPENCA